jgi:hypothetical protein
MRDDHYEGKDLADPGIRALFTRESVLSSDWYRQRLMTKQQVDVRLWKRHVGYLERFLRNPSYALEAERLGVAARLEHALTECGRMQEPAYLESLVGMTGAEPSVPVPTGPPV